MLSDSANCRFQIPGFDAMSFREGEVFDEMLSASDVLGFFINEIFSGSSIDRI
jgi:hypothetical protein